MKNIKKILLFLLCFILVIGLFFIGKIYLQHNAHLDGLPILGYHGVVSDEDKEKYYSRNVYVMSESYFDKQMKYLYDNNYQTLTMEQVNDFYHKKLDIKGNAVVLTFDDGLSNVNTIIKDILKKYNFHATAFVIGKKTTIKDSNDPRKYSYLKQNDLVNDQYISYYSHSYNLHRNSKTSNKKIIETSTLKYIQEDFKNNKDIVSDTYFAFPYGISSQNAEIVLKENNVKLAFSYNQFRNMDSDDNKYLLPRYLTFDRMPFWYFKWITERK